jgi:hypothetical protein
MRAKDGKLVRGFVQKSLRSKEKVNWAERLREGDPVNASRDKMIAEEFKFADAEVDGELALHTEEMKSNASKRFISCRR